jgi:ParB-like chromosome segregation protein Spo0J
MGTTSEFRLMVNRSVNWASWDDELLALELQELSEADFDLSLTGFDPGEIDALLVDPEDEEKANAAPPLPEEPIKAVKASRQRRNISGLLALKTLRCLLASSRYLWNIQGTDVTLTLSVSPLLAGHNEW